MRPRRFKRPTRVRAAVLGAAVALGTVSSSFAGIPETIPLSMVPSSGLAVAPLTLVDPYATAEPDATPDPGLPAAPELPLEPEPAPTDDESLAIGITEPNPSLIWPAGAGSVPSAFAPWRDAVGALRPPYYRMHLDWARLQPQPDSPPDFDRAEPGCMRDRLPCAPWRGLREQLRALAARQVEGGWETVVAISGTPTWAARAPAGCERAGTGPRSRAPRSDALPAYRQFVADVLATAAAVGAELKWWNAWNEPNHPYFISPQRLECDVEAPSESLPNYLELHAALGEALDAAPGEQQRVLGDLAGIDGSREDVVSVTDFIAALPRDVVCGTSVWAQHSYLAPRNDARVARRALAAHECPTLHEIWVTETGARNTDRDPAPDRRCRSMNQRLRVWRADPQVRVAFQYTVREDDRFPYGLVGTDLREAYPVLAMWQAWGATARRSPTDPPPDSDVVCPAPPAASGGQVDLVPPAVARQQAQWWSTKSSSISSSPAPAGIGPVVRPRTVTYRVTCHQWLRDGTSDMRTFPRICA